MNAQVHHIHADTEVFECPLSVRSFDTDNWGKVNRFEQVVALPDIGKGKRFEEGMVFRAFRSVFLGGAGWQSTEWFKYNLKLIESGRPLWKCRSKEDLLQRLNGEVRALYDSMQTHGFLEQQMIADRVASRTSNLERFAQAEYHVALSPQHEIKVGINEAGELLFLDGRHRLAIAKLLHIRRIPVRVVFVQKAFLDQRWALTAGEPGRAASWSEADVPALLAGFFAAKLHRQGTDACIGFDEYMQAAQASPRAGGYWRNAAARWGYHKTAIDFVRLCKPRAAADVLELCTRGVPLVRGSHTLGAAQSADPAQRRTAHGHDARQTPWPLQSKQYQVLVGLRVFHHLWPVQQACFLEAKRVARNLILLVPDTFDVPALKDSSAGISEAQFTAWNNGVAPTVSVKLPDEMGTLYYWNEETLLNR